MRQKYKFVSTIVLISLLLVSCSTSISRDISYSWPKKRWKCCCSGSEFKWGM
jgi:PBP1b-binding outer membrane lipoprotein LpoB